MVAFDLSIPAQVFGHRRELHYRFTACSPGRGRFPSTTESSIAASDRIHVFEHADTIVVPDHDPVVGPAGFVLDALRRAQRRGGRVVSVSIGAFAPAHAGLLDGRSATTHWQQIELRVRRFPRGRLDAEVLFVDHGDIATSAGVAAGVDLCLHLVHRGRHLPMPVPPPPGSDTHAAVIDPRQGVTDIPAHCWTRGIAVGVPSEVPHPWRPPPDLPLG